MQTLDITIIVPVYNAEEFLRECLDSICSQTYKQWKCVLVNDGSTDRSQTIIDEYCKNDGRFTCLIKKNEKSAALARRYALERNDSEWIMSVDADDAISPDLLEKCVARQIETNADCVTGYRIGCSDGLSGENWRLPLKDFDMSLNDINIKLNPYQVREDEFNNACDFKGITRMQSEANATIVETDGTIETISQRYETSELICHTVEQSECYSVTVLYEEYARKDTIEADHCEYVYKEGEGEWSDPATSYELNDYPFTGHYYNPINNIGSGIYEPSIEFSNFNFIDNKYIYEGIDTSDGEIIKMELNFKNKILVNTKKHTDSDIYGTKDFEAIYLFEDIVPSWPLPE